VKLKSMLWLSCVLLFGPALFAQDDPKIEIPVGYSHVWFKPETSNIVMCGSPSGLKTCPFSLNGLGGGVALYLKKWFAIAGDFQGYGSNSLAAFIFPAGKITGCPNGCAIVAQGNLVTYNALAIAKFRARHFEPFFEAGFGGAYTNLYANLYNNCTGCLGEKPPSNNSFDFIIGGGIDIPLTHHIAFRPGEFDFLRTKFSNVFTPGYPNQNNFRCFVGVVARL
jgi:opacity protein-like surface antigen